MIYNVLLLNFEVFKTQNSLWWLNFFFFSGFNEKLITLLQRFKFSLVVLFESKLVVNDIKQNLFYLVWYHIYFTMDLTIPQFTYLNIFSFIGSLSEGLVIILRFNSSLNKTLLQLKFDLNLLLLFKLGVLLVILLHLKA